MAAASLAAILLLSVPVRGLEVSARQAVLLDGYSGETLWEKDPDTPALIASTTKIMTALVVLERCGLGDMVEVPPEAAGVEGSSMYLRAGETLTVEDLLYGLMLASGNDAAAALAIHTAGSPEAFTDLMNEKAAELGLRDMHFANPHGLDAPENYASPRSLGRLAMAAMDNPDFRAIVSTRRRNAGDRVLVNHNKLLGQYPGAVGVKTGYTRAAGRILVGAAEREGRRLISVTLSAPDDWEDHRKLLDYGFSRYEIRPLVTAGQQVGTIPLLFGDREDLPLLAEETVEFPLLPGETPAYRIVALPYVTAAHTGSAGTLQVFLHGRLVGQTAVKTAPPA